MKQFTICHYVGSVDNIQETIYTEVVEAESINDVNYMNVCFNYIGPIKDHPQYHKWSCKNTGFTFTCYYCRSLLFSEKIISVDYGEHSRFITIVEGNHAEDIKEYFNTEIANYYEAMDRKRMC